MKLRLLDTSNLLPIKIMQPLNSFAAEFMAVIWYRIQSFQGFEIFASSGNQACCPEKSLAENDLKSVEKALAAMCQIWILNCSDQFTVKFS
jgi:hypothetical protein